MKIKKRLTALALLLAFITSGGMFAYWATNVLGTTANATPKITIGVGDPVNTTLTLTPTVVGGNLVPAGFATKTHDVEQIVHTYQVQLTSNQNAAEGTMAELNVVYNNSAHALINVAIDKPSQAIVVDGAVVTVTITITLTEPADEAEYLQVANQEFDISLTFTATIN